MEIKGRRVKVIFFDGANHYSKKVGIWISESDSFVFLLEDDVLHLIPKQRIIRVEVVE